MSTSTEVEDLAALQDAVKRVRSDNGDVNRRAWVVVSHVDNKPNLIKLAAEGEGFEEFKESLVDDQVTYALLRLSSTFDMSTTVKFVCVHWVGENVRPILKGRFGVVQGSVLEHLSPYHLHVETSTLDDLHEEALVHKLDESSGTRSKVVEGSTAGMQMRGFTQHSVQKQEKGHLRSVAPAGVVVEVDPELQQAIGEVRNDSNATSWVLGGYEEGNLKKPLVCVAKGTGTIDELTDQLDDGQVMYGVYRTSDMIDEISTVKFVYIYWVGEKVKPLTKGKVSAFAGPVEKVFSPTHVCLSFTNRYDITAKVISDKVTASSGSKSFVK